MYYLTHCNLIQGIYYIFHDSRLVVSSTTFSKAKQPKRSHTRRSFVGFLRIDVHRASSRVPPRERGRVRCEEPAALKRQHETCGSEILEIRIEVIKIHFASGSGL